MAARVLRRRQRPRTRALCWDWACRTGRWAWRLRLPEQLAAERLLGRAMRARRQPRVRDAHPALWISHPSDCGCAPPMLGGGRSALGAGRATAVWQLRRGRWPPRWHRPAGQQPCCGTAQMAEAWRPCDIGCNSGHDRRVVRVGGSVVLLQGGGAGDGGSRRIETTCGT